MRPLRSPATRYRLHAFDSNRILATGDGAFKESAGKRQPSQATTVVLPVLADDAPGTVRHDSLNDLEKQVWIALHLCNGIGIECPHEGNREISMLVRCEGETAYRIGLLEAHPLLLDDSDGRLK